MYGGKLFLSRNAAVVAWRSPASVIEISGGKVASVVLRVTVKLSLSSQLESILGRHIQYIEASRLDSGSLPKGRPDGYLAEVAGRQMP
jgi:hypothetical protein